MNVNDFDNTVPTGDLLRAVFERQTMLIEKYHDVETRNIGIELPTIPYDLNDRRAQYRIKDFAWRITEELTEATECMGAEDRTHYLEELIDAMHFYVELLVYLGMSPEFVTGYVMGPSTPPRDLMQGMFDSCLLPASCGYSFVRSTVYSVIESIGLAMNCLKNKPWKQTHMVTDRLEFERKLLDGFRNFIMLLKMSGYTHETATLMYLNKNDVNQFRIRSQY